MFWFKSLKFYKSIITIGNQRSLKNGSTDQVEEGGVCIHVCVWEWKFLIHSIVIYEWISCPRMETGWKLDLCGQFSIAFIFHLRFSTWCGLVTIICTRMIVFHLIMIGHFRNTIQFICLPIKGQQATGRSYID